MSVLNNETKTGGKSPKNLILHLKPKRKKNEDPSKGKSDKPKEIKNQNSAQLFVFGTGSVNAEHKTDELKYFKFC